MHKIIATFGIHPKSRSAFYSALYLAAFFLLAALSQLFAFEDFPEVISGYGLPIDASFSVVIAAIVVSLEVLAIPFLLFMKISPLMRLTSMLAGVLALVFWLVVGIWQNMSGVTFLTAGLFGSAISVPQGWWLVTYVIALIVLFAFIVWSTMPLELSAHGKSLKKRKKS